MIGFQLTQGMGNNFYQIALTTTQACKLGVPAKFSPSPWMPASQYAAIFKNNLDWTFNHEEVKAIYSEPHYHYAPIPIQDGLELRGYFQSPKYFDKEIALELFEPRASIIDAIKAERSNLLALAPVSIHVRRGNYIEQSKWHPVHGMDFFNKAMALFPNRIFVIFSDDMPWCYEQFGGRDDVVFIDHTVCYSEFFAVDFFLMAMCQDNIIANSTFSYWAAYLNPNPDHRVIAPLPWFGPAYDQHNIKDLLPREWEIIEAIPWKIG